MRRPPDGMVEKVVKSGREPKSQVGVVFSGPFVTTLGERLIRLGHDRALEGNLQRVLRERSWADLRGQRRPAVRQAADAVLPRRHLVRLRPGRTDVLVKALFRSIAQFKANGPARADLGCPAALGRDYEVNSKETATC